MWATAQCKDRPLPIDTAELQFGHAADAIVMAAFNARAERFDHGTCAQAGFAGQARTLPSEGPWQAPMLALNVPHLRCVLLDKFDS